MSLRVFFGLVLGLLTALDATAQFRLPDQDLCTSPNGTSGKCINLKTCPELLSLLLQKPLTQANINFLRGSHCGYEKNDPKVCCVSAYNQIDRSRPSNISDPDSVNVQNHPNLRLLDNKLCGPITMSKLASVGGNQALFYEYPWVAIIAYRRSEQPSSKPKFHCGGSIINKRYIMTAAQCVTSLPSTLKLHGVRVGEYDLSKERDCEFEGTVDEYCTDKYQDFLIQNYHYHPQFSAKELANDIALIRLDRDIDFKPENARPICMPTEPPQRPFHKMKMTAAGWGLEEMKVSSPVLMKVALPRFPQDQCIDIYKKKDRNITSKQICYGSELGKNPCNGDLGGPLMRINIFNGIPRYVQYGIVSFGLQRCDQLEVFPGVYTRVDQYLDWILDNMRD